MKNQKGHILISGSSIAGPCLAYWLNKSGFKTTVIEKSPKFRDGGQNIDISGVARTIVDRMGLLEKVEAQNTTEVGLKFVNGKGSAIATFPQNGDDSFTSEYEIRRGDLSRLFYEASKDQTNYRFGTWIESIHELADSIQAKFSDGSTESFDLIVSAEGVGSPTRKLVMGEEVSLKYLGIWMGYFRIPAVPEDDRWARWYNATKGRVIMMRPSSPGRRAVTVGFRSDDPQPKHLTREEQQKAFKTVLAGAGWQSERIIANLGHDDDMYLGPILQVKAKDWSKGRFVLVGDAADGPSPITGMGTTLAVMGAYILAGEISKGDDLLAALKSYQRILQPYVEKVQQLPPGVPLIVYPRTSLGVAIVRSGARIFGSKTVRTLREVFKPRKTGRKESDEFILPDYTF